MKKIPLKSVFGRGRGSAIEAQLLFLSYAMLAVEGRAAETVVTAPAASSAASKVLARYEKVLAAARKDPPDPGTISASAVRTWNFGRLPPGASFL
jgi:hypothetical protein